MKISDLLRNLLPQAAKPVTNAAKKGVLGAGLGAANMNPKQDMPMLPEYRQMKPLLSRYEKKPYRLPDGGTSEFINRPNVVSNWNMRQQPEDASYMQTGQGLSPISSDIANWNQRRPFQQSPISAMQGGWGPVDMDTVPTNNTSNRTGYYQGSNPNLNSLEDLKYRLRVR